MKIELIRYTFKNKFITITVDKEVLDSLIEIKFNNNPDKVKNMSFLMKVLKTNNNCNLNHIILK